MNYLTQLLKLHSYRMKMFLLSFKTVAFRYNKTKLQLNVAEIKLHLNMVSRHLTHHHLYLLSSTLAKKNRHREQGFSEASTIRWDNSVK